MFQQLKIILIGFNCTILDLEVFFRFNSVLSVVKIEMLEHFNIFLKCIVQKWIRIFKIKSLAVILHFPFYKLCRNPGLIRVLHSESMSSAPPCQETKVADNLYQALKIHVGKCSAWETHQESQYCESCRHYTRSVPVYNTLLEKYPAFILQKSGGFQHLAS